ncbi:MAG: hypothetical protein IPL52_02925 [Flavobacteriales bacterium]|nr:hypothetical protein [Flavobacteriales bacterium]
MDYPIDTSGQFLAISSVLTGFSAIELQGTGSADAIWATATTIVGAPILGDLLTDCGELFEKSKDIDALEAAFAKRVIADPRYGPVAKNFIGAWYTGVWAALPSAWCDAYGASGSDGTFVISPTVYKSGLQWKAFGGTPRGGVPTGHGAWNRPPLTPINTNAPKP